MFAVLVAGRLVQSEFVQVSASKIIFPLDNATQVQTLSVFMTGSQRLPEGAGAVIYLGWPPFDSWSYLGHLTNVLPSAFFKISQADPPSGPKAVAAHFGPLPQDQRIVAHIGIEVAELSAIEHQFGRREVRRERQLSDWVLFVQATMESLYNYASSYQFEIRNDATGQLERILPLALFDRWYSNFLAKLKANPDFWRKG